MVSYFRMSLSICLSSKVNLFIFLWSMIFLIFRFFFLTSFSKVTSPIYFILSIWTYFITQAQLLEAKVHKDGWTVAHLYSLINSLKGESYLLYNCSAFLKWSIAVLCLNTICLSQLLSFHIPSSMKGTWYRLCMSRYILHRPVIFVRKPNQMLSKKPTF